MKKGVVIKLKQEKEKASVNRAVRLTPSEAREVDLVMKRERRSFANIVRLCLANEIARLEGKPFPYRWR